jgi:DNA-binding transcriptional regulator PaaX
VAVAGIMSVGLLAPNALQMLKLINLDKKLLRDKKHAINLSKDRLIKNGLITYNKDGFLALTKLGEESWRKIKLYDHVLPKPRKWDKKWRVLIFDIKEEFRKVRDQIRKTLISIGFIHLQDSVWVYPYDCEDLIILLKADFEIGKDLLYIIADSIENDKDIKKHFGLI